ncbi:hypothetical protein FB563_7568 [Streptomyces puniciscabiei]|uniref:Uncharacterized protein n=1 Tax=Streptomyces puniciscabiei TaxID=164348 RepID=A0A542SYM1_9ACTN|nr:hypothetical protein FB563_7568 [Streptomyces puniciscabiei]
MGGAGERLGPGRGPLERAAARADPGAGVRERSPEVPYPRPAAQGASREVGER